MSGVHTCGHITCPRCGWLIRQKERARLLDLHRAHLSAGGGMLHGVLTVSHGPLDGLADLLDVLQTARGVAMGKAAGGTWTRTRKRHGVTGWTGHLQITRGRNGWHPHFHVVIYTDRPQSDAEAEAFSSAIFGRYLSGLEAEGYRADPAFNRFEPVRNAEAAARYLTLDEAADVIASEVTAEEGKVAKGRTPVQILTDYTETGDTADLYRFLAFEQAMEGRRWRQWSPGLAKRYDIGTATDEDDATEDPAEGETEDEADAREEIGGEVVFSVSTMRYRELARDPATVPRILDLIERGHTDEARTLAGLPPLPPPPPSGSTP